MISRVLRMDSETEVLERSEEILRRRIVFLRWRLESDRGRREMKLHGIRSSIFWRRRNSRIHEEMQVSIWMENKKKGFADI